MKSGVKITKQEKDEFLALCEKLSDQMRRINNSKEQHSQLAVSA